MKNFILLCVLLIVNPIFCFFRDNDLNLAPDLKPKPALPSGKTGPTKHTGNRADGMGGMGAPQMGMDQQQMSMNQPMPGGGQPMSGMDQSMSGPAAMGMNPQVQNQQQMGMDQPMSGQSSMGMNQVMPDQQQMGMNQPMQGNQMGMNQPMQGNQMGMNQPMSMDHSIPGGHAPQAMSADQTMSADAMNTAKEDNSLTMAPDLKKMAADRKMAADSKPGSSKDVHFSSQYSFFQSWSIVEHPQQVHYMAANMAIEIYKTKISGYCYSLNWQCTNFIFKQVSHGSTEFWFNLSINNPCQRNEMCTFRAIILYHQPTITAYNCFPHGISHSVQIHTPQIPVHPGPFHPGPVQCFTPPCHPVPGPTLHFG